jgi:hypothetical protein
MLSLASIKLLCGERFFIGSPPSYSFPVLPSTSASWNPCGFHLVFCFACFKSTGCVQPSVRCPPVLPFRSMAEVRILLGNFRNPHGKTIYCPYLWQFATSQPAQHWSSSVNSRPTAQSVAVTYCAYCDQRQVQILLRLKFLFTTMGTGN